MRLSELPAGCAPVYLSSLLDTVMEAVVSVDESQHILICNPAAERMFGWQAAELRGQPLSVLIPRGDRHAHEEHVRRFGATGMSNRRMSGSAIVRALRKDGQEFPVDAAISQVETPRGKLYTVVLREVSDRVEAAREQANLAARLSALVDSAMDGVITTDDKQRVILYNRAAERMFGWPAVQVMGRSLDMLIPPRYRGLHRQHVERFGATGVTTRRMGGGMVLLGLRADGSEFPIDASISQLDTPDGKLYTVILRDVTERVRAQDEMAAYAAQAANAREQEQARIARELHDDVAQSLAAAKMDAQMLLKDLGVQSALGSKIAGVVELIDGAVASTRRIAADLRPLVLDDLGLPAGLEWLASGFSRRNGIECHLDVDADFELEEPHATTVFRLVQESLTNVAKHAGARQVEVVLRCQGGGMAVLEVRDDGVGFDPAAPRRHTSLGMAGMHERARLLRGTLQVDSEPGKGTQLRLSFPCDRCETSG